MKLLFMWIGNSKLSIICLHFNKYNTLYSSRIVTRIFLYYYLHYDIILCAYLRVPISFFTFIAVHVCNKDISGIYLRNGSIDGCLQYHRKNKIKTGGGFGVHTRTHTHTLHITYNIIYCCEYFAVTLTY